MEKCVFQVCQCFLLIVEIAVDCISVADADILKAGWPVCMCVCVVQKIIR